MERIINNNLLIQLNNYSETLFLGTLRKEISAFEELNTIEEYIVVGALITATVVGSFYKSSLYFYCYDKFKGRGNTPIDVLILVNAIIQHTVTAFLTLNYSVGLIFDITFSDYLGEAWCNIIWYAGVYGGAYRAIGSLGLAILRLRYIHCDYVLSDSIGRNSSTRLMLTILILGLLVSTGLTIAFGTGNGPASRKQVTWNWCIGNSERLREVEQSYKF